jgi:signal transduction histidine kinase
MQWIGLAVAMCVEVSVLLLALHVLTGWPSNLAPAAAGSLVLVAAALVAAATPRLVSRVDRLLTHAVSFAGLTTIVTVVYLCVVVGLGRAPTDDDKGAIAVSIGAAVIATLAYVAARAQLIVLANHLVYGYERDPGEALDTFGSRLTRALPMDELLLQLAELCKKHLTLTSSDVWAVVGGQLTLAASVPDRGEEHLELDHKQLPVLTRARVSGRGWAEVWMPQLLVGRGSGPVQIVPMTHGGQLFGLLVLEREHGAEDFNEEEGRVVTELARQVALALHNSELDTALRATVEEVQRKNVELQESRARIVATADAERRKIERNLHDGAQQHLVALAVKLRLIQRVGEKDPAQALAMLEDARNATLATVEELRALAHGIYPPLLMEKGLADALRAAAGRSFQPTTVVAKDLGRYPQDIEAAVYFCCLEAMQNAGKHAGDGASVTVRVEYADGELRFAVEDDGIGFDTSGPSMGHGFVNMADRIGAIGGTAEVTAAPGQGTRVSGRVPVAMLG